MRNLHGEICSIHSAFCNIAAKARPTIGETLAGPIAEVPQAMCEPAALASVLRKSNELAELEAVAQSWFEDESQVAQAVERARRWRELAIVARALADGRDGGRIDARYRIVDDCGPQGRWADIREPQACFVSPIRRAGGRGRRGCAPNRKKKYSSFNNIRVRSFILDGALFCCHFG